MFHYAAAEGHEGCFQTSLPCCGYKTEAERSNREMIKGKGAEEYDEEGSNEFSCTHQSIEHLKQHSTKAPPVHCRAIRGALQHLRSEVLWSSTECMHNATYGHPFFTQPKVSQHHMARTVQQDVLWFEVSDRETGGTELVLLLKKSIN